MAASVVFGSVAHAATPPTVHFSGGQSVLPSSELDGPYGLAVDGSGNVYIADSLNHRVLKETLSGGSYTESTIPTIDLLSPFGLAVDARGNVYIANNERVLKETLSGGSYVQSTVVSISGAWGLAVDALFNVYIADPGNHRVLKETPSGSAYTETTVASNGLNWFIGVAVDGNGNVYIADTYNNRVLKETPSGSAYTESTVASSGLDWPEAVTVDGKGDVYITNSLGSNNLLVKETPSGDSYTESMISIDGDSPVDYRTVPVAVNGSGSNLYIVGPTGNSILRLQESAVDLGPVNAGSTSSTIPLIFTFDTGGRLGGTAVLTQGAPGLDFADAGTGSCTAGTAYAVSNFCILDVTLKPRHPGVSLGAAELLDSSGNILATASLTGTGVGPQVSFLPGSPVPIDSGLSHPFGVAVDASGNVFFAENATGTVYKETLSGGAYLRTAVASGLSDPTGVAVDGSGNVYIAASDGVYKETLSNGSYSQSQIVSDLKDLVGIAVDGSGNLYITASATGDVHKETLQVGGGYIDTGIGFGIAGPTGVAVDGRGNIYVTDAKSGEAYQETLQGDGSYVQTTLAGGLAGPESVAVDGGGNLYITGFQNGEVYKEALQTNGSYLQTIVAVGLNGPWWIAVDGRGNIYLSQDTSRGDLAMIEVADSPSLSFAKTTVGYTSPDSPQTITVANIGNAALAFPTPGSGTNPSITASFALGSATTCPEVGPSGTAGKLDVGSSCVYEVDFIPAVRGPISGSLVLTDTNLNAVSPSYAMQSMVLSGTGMTSDATRTTMRVSPNPVTVDLGLTMIATVIDTTKSATVPNGGVTFTDSVGGTTVSLNGGAAVPLTDGKASLNIIPSTAGAHTITAHYDGVDDSFVSSTGQASLTVLP